MQYVGVGVSFEEFCGIVYFVGDQCVVSGLDCYVGNGVFVVGNVFVVCQLVIQYIQLMFDFYGVLVDWVFVFFWSVGVEMFEFVVQYWCIVYLLEQLVQSFGVFGDVFWQECIEFFCQVQQD